MTRPRPIHDCPYCGRTKSADDTLPCCEDDLFAMRLEWQWQKDCRDKKPTEWGGDPKGGKMYVDIGEEFSR